MTYSFYHIRGSLQDRRAIHGIPSKVRVLQTLSSKSCTNRIKSVGALANSASFKQTLPTNCNITNVHAQFEWLVFVYSTCGIGTSSMYAAIILFYRQQFLSPFFMHGYSRTWPHALSYQIYIS